MSCLKEKAILLSLVLSIPLESHVVMALMIPAAILVNNKREDKESFCSLTR